MGSLVKGVTCTIEHELNALTQSLQTRRPAPLSQYKPDPQLPLREVLKAFLTCRWRGYWSGAPATMC